MRWMFLIMTALIWGCSDEQTIEPAYIHITINEPSQFTSRAVNEKTAWVNDDKVLLIVRFGNNRRQWVDSTFVVGTYNGTGWNYSREVIWDESYYYMHAQAYYAKGKSPDITRQGFDVTGLEDVLYVQSDTVEVPQITLSKWQHKRSRLTIHVQDKTTGVALAGVGVTLKGVDYYSRFGAIEDVEKYGTLTATSDTDGDVTFFCSWFVDVESTISVDGGIEKSVYSWKNSIDGMAYNICYYK